MLYLWTNAALLFLNDTATSMHSHYAFEIYMGLGSSFQMDTGSGFKRYRCLGVNSNAPHQFSGDSGPYALILLNPGDYRMSRLILTLLGGRKYKDFGDLPWLGHSEMDSGTAAVPFTCDTALEWVKDQLINFNREFAGLTFGVPKAMDPRIKRSCVFINHSCKETIRLSDLASSACLSESRFRHLFKRETGITIRQFILNARTVVAARLIIRGLSKTEAAHEAGFSDSAHLSRTFRSMYGLTLSELYKSNQRTAVHLCSGGI